MHRSKRFKALSLMMMLLLIAAVALAGCASKSNTPNTETTPESAVTPEATVAPEPTPAPTEKPLEFLVELTWYLPPPLPTQPNEVNVMAEVNKILKEKINASVKFVFVDWGSYNDKIKVMTAAGDPFDLVMTASWLGYTDNAARGAFLPIDELLQKYGQHVYKAIKEEYWDATRVNGKINAVINPFPWAFDVGFAYKKDLIDKYGFDYVNVHDLKSLEPYLETIKKNEPGIVPFGATGQYTPSVVHMDYLDQITSYVVYDTKQEKLLKYYDVPEMDENWKLLTEWYKKGYISKSAATIKDENTEMKKGKNVVMSSGGNVYSEDGSKATGTYGFPSVESFFTHGMINTGTLQTVLTGISKTSKNPERAMMLIDLLYSDKAFLNLVTTGILGQDYKIVAGEGTDLPTVELNNPQTWAIPHSWIANNWDQYPSNVNTESVLKEMKRSSDEAAVSPLIGFSFNPEPVKTEVTQCSAIYAEAAAVLYTGIAPDYDKYMTELKDKYTKAGIDKVMAELQKQLDQWKKDNGK